MTTACPRAPRGKKKNNNNNNNKLILTEKAREKQHKLRMNIRNVYISV